MTRHAAISGTGRCVPKRMITNAELEQALGEEFDAWLVDNIGIEQRHVIADDESTSDLAVAAAEQALARADVRAEDVDLVIVATDTPDYLSPPTATVVQARLGAHNAGAFDLNAACAGWVTALDLASKTIISDASYRHVLVIGAYAMTRFLDWTNKQTATLFADGAGAVVLSASDRPGYRAARLEAQGQHNGCLGIFTGGARRPATLETVRETGAPRVEFVQRLPPTFNVEHWPPLVGRVLRAAGLETNDVDLFLFTQVNLRSIQATMRALDQPLTKTHWIMDKWGYTGSTCIPMALDDAVLQGKLAPGKNVVFCASGGGVCMAAAAFTWTSGKP